MARPARTPLTDPARNPLLFEEFVSSKRGLSLSALHEGSGIRCKWQCNVCQNNWETPLYVRTLQKHGCKKCGAKAIRESRLRTLALKNPITSELLIKEFDPDNPMKIDQLSRNSGVRVGWICSNCGNKWKAHPSNRHNGRGCSTCALIRRGIDHRKRAAKDNPISCPILIGQYSKNNPDPISHFSINSHKVRAWTCPSHGDWMSNFANRNKGQGCPECATKRQLSQGCLYWLISQKIPNAWYEAKGLLKNRRFTFDIFLPDLDVAVELDGEIWHGLNKDGTLGGSERALAAQERDARKNQECKDAGIYLIRIPWSEFIKDEQGVADRICQQIREFAGQSSVKNESAGLQVQTRL